MKKPVTIVLAVVAAIAVIFSCVFGVQKGNLQSAKTDLEKQLTEAASAAEATKADLEKQLEDAASAAATELENAKAEAEKQIADATAGAEAAKAELEQQLADAQAAAEATKADLEKQLADAQAAAAEAAEAAKAEADKAVADLTAQLETVKTEAEAAKAELEAQVTMLEGEVRKSARAALAATCNAYIMYANADWSVANWGTADSEDGSVIVEPAYVTGEGDYTVSLEFAAPAEGLAFTALGIKDGEYFLPFYSYTITGIRVNGEAIEIGKGYTNSDDGKETRVNIYNEWVSDLPSDAHTADGDLTDCSPVIVNKDAFASVSTVEVDFHAEPLKAYLMFANGDWSVQNWGTTDSEDGSVKVTAAPVTGAGDAFVSLNFETPSEGLAFAAVGIKNAEKLMPGYILQVNGVFLNENGEENLLIGKSYTNSDDGVETRANVYNEWVSELPVDARTEDGDLSTASPIIVDKEAFTNVSSVTVTFKIIKAQPIASAAAAEEPMSQEEADALKAAGFHAYIGVQGTSTYVFRNAWNDNYGLNDEANPFFYRLTGWDGSEAVDYGGTFADADITGDGEYTVSLTTGEMGFGATESFNLLFVSTDIPSKLITDGYLTISDVKTKIGDAATQDYTEIDTEGDYAMIKVIDTYNQTSEPFGYTVPGADAPISITFTVSGW